MYSGEDIQNRAINLFGRFFGKQLLSKEVTIFPTGCHARVPQFTFSFAGIKI